METLEKKGRVCFLCTKIHEEKHCPEIMEDLRTRYCESYFGWYVWKSIEFYVSIFCLLILSFAFVLPLKILAGTALCVIMVFILGI